MPGNADLGGGAGSTTRDKTSSFIKGTSENLAASRVQWKGKGRLFDVSKGRKPTTRKEQGY